MTIEEHKPLTGLPMPAPSRADALTTTEPSAFAARLTFDCSVQTICASSFSPAKMSLAVEREIVTAFMDFALVKRTFTLALNIEMKVELFPLPVIDNGGVIT
jgi:hypothetical protein